MNYAALKNKILNLREEFVTLDLYKKWNLNEKEKTRASKIINRLYKIGKLKKIAPKTYEVIKTNNKPIELGKEPKPFEINWPFKLENIFSIYQKSIIVIAGEKSAGKSAFLMRLAYLNRDKDIYYFDSELGEPILNDRIITTGLPITEWKKIHFFTCWKDFDKAIVPNKINLIDSFTMFKDFYKINEELHKLWQILNDGIVITTIQKDPQKANALGGIFSKFTSQVYLTLIFGKRAINEKELILSTIKKFKTKEDPTDKKIYYRINKKLDLIETGRDKELMINGDRN